MLTTWAAKNWKSSEAETCHKTRIPKTWAIFHVWWGNGFIQPRYIYIYIKDLLAFLKTQKKTKKTLISWDSEQNVWDPHETLRSNDHTHYSNWPDFRMHWRMTKNRRNTLYPDMRKVFDTVSHLEILTEAKPVSGISRVICQSCQEEVPIRSALINGTNPTQFPSGIHSVPCQMGIEWDGCHLWGHV